MNLFWKIIWTIVIAGVVAFAGWLLLDKQTVFFRILGFAAIAVIAAIQAYKIWFENKSVL